MLKLLSVPSTIKFLLSSISPANPLLAHHSSPHLTALSISPFTTTLHPRARYPSTRKVLHPVLLSPVSPTPRPASEIEARSQRGKLATAAHAP